MWDIRQEHGDDQERVDSLVAASFGPGRYAKSAYRLREGVEADPALSFVAIEDGILRGSVRFWPVFVGVEPALLLGPLAVESAQRGRGIGIALMNHGIEEARRLGHRAIVLIGDLPYYSRVGFVPLRRGIVEFSGPVDAGRLLGLALAEGALDTLSGPVRRARLTTAICAEGANWGPASAA
jgi:predicted N-acetyltransferase YhbS